MFGLFLTKLRVVQDIQDRTVLLTAKYLKPIIRKSADMDIALLNVRATSLDSVLPSTELILGRQIPTILPSHT